MELGLLHDFSGNFSTRGERYYFGWRGAREVRICTWGENVYSRWAWGDFEWWRGHVRWEYVSEVRMCMKGDFEWWRGAHKVRICTWGENVYTRWECVLEMGTRWLSGGRGTWGENMYVSWECVHEVRMCMRGDFEWWRGHTRWEWSCKVRIAMQGGNGHMRWELPREVGMVTWGENCHARWEWSCEVRIATRGGNGHMRWELPRKVGMVTQDENCHMRWEWSREVRIATQGGNGHARWELPCKVGMVTQGENCHARWEWSHKVRITMQGVNGHARWELPREVGMVTWDTSHLVKFFTPWYLNNCFAPFIMTQLSHWSVKGIILHSWRLSFIKCS